MNKRFILTVIGILVVVGLGVYFVMNYNPLPEEVVISKFDIVTHNLIKEIKITDKKEIKQISKYVNQLKTLTDREMVDLGIIREIEIKYEDLTVAIQLGEKTYCSCLGTSEKCSGMSKIPAGFYDYVESKLS